MPEKRYGRLTQPWDCLVLPTNSQWQIFVAMLLDGCAPTDLSFLYPYILCQTTLKCDVRYSQMTRQRSINVRRGWGVGNVHKNSRGQRPLTPTPYF